MTIQQARPTVQSRGWAVPPALLALSIVPLAAGTSGCSSSAAAPT